MPSSNHRLRCYGRPWKSLTAAFLGPLQSLPSCAPHGLECLGIALAREIILHVVREERWEERSGDGGSSG